MNTAKNSAMFYIAIAFTIVSLSFCIYHTIPGIYHAPVPDWAEPTKVHEKYVALFGGLAVLGAIGALIIRFNAGSK